METKNNFEHFLGLTSTNSNRNFPNQTPDQINTTLPVSLLFRMREMGYDPNYISLKNNSWHVGEVPIENILGDGMHSKYFNFEAPCENASLNRFSRTALPRADLFIAEMENRKEGRPFEVKMVVTPDNTTRTLAPALHAPELVIRPDTIAYLAAFICAADINLVSNEITANNFTLRSNNVEDAKEHFTGISQTIKNIAHGLEPNQTPFLYAPIWKTNPDSNKPSDQCFDAFFFSDAAFAGLVADVSPPKTEIGRPERAAIWLYGLMKEVVFEGNFDYENFFANNSFSVKNDKAFAAAGRRMIRYMQSPNLERPRLSWGEISNMMVLNSANKKRTLTDTIVQYYPEHA